MARCAFGPPAFGSDEAYVSIGILHRLIHTFLLAVLFRNQKGARANFADVSHKAVIAAVCMYEVTPQAQLEHTPEQRII